MKVRNCLMWRMRLHLATETVESLIKRATTYGEAIDYLFWDMDVIVVRANKCTKELTVKDKTFRVFDDWLEKHDAIQYISKLI